MAAGQGFKTFATGDVLSASDVNGYLMQGVLVFADSAERDAEITSPQEGQFAYLKDTNVTTYYTGSAWANLDTTGMTNPMTTTGDTIYSSSGSTPARLGIGSTGQVLTVAGGVPSWATPAGGTSGMTLIARTSFSNVASQAFDSVFNTTYSNYLVVIDQIYAATGDDDLHLQMRYAGPTTQTATYYGSAAQWSVAGTPSTIASNNAAQWTISGQTGSSGTFGSGHIFFNVVGDASKAPVIRGQFTDKDANQLVFGGNQDTARVYTGFLLKSSSTNITGIVSIYGMAKS